MSDRGAPRPDRRRGSAAGTAAATADDEPVGRDRVLFSALLTAVMTAGTLTQFALGALGPFVVEYFSLSRFRLGLLNSSYFAAAAAAAWAVGRLADRWGNRRTLAAMLAWQTGALLAMSFARGYATLIAAVVASGAAAAVSNPVTNNLALDRLPPEQRGVTLGVKQSGPWIGAIIAGVVLAPVTARFGLRVGFLVAAGSVAAVWCAATVWASSHVRQRRRMVDQFSRLPPELWVLVPYATLMGIGGSALTAYLALFVKEGIGLGGAVGGYALGLMGFAAVVGRIWWGRMSETWSRRTSPLAVISLLAAPGAVLLAISATLASAAMMWSAVLVLGVTAVSWTSVVMVGILRASPSDSAGRASGVVVAGFYSGLLVGPLLVGVLLRLTDSYAVSWLVVAGAFLMAGLLIKARPVAWGTR